MSTCGTVNKCIPTFKLGIEVKAMFIKSHENVNTPGVDLLLKYWIMFINRVFQKVIPGQLTQVNLEALGSLISSIEW